MTEIVRSLESISAVPNNAARTGKSKSVKQTIGGNGSERLEPGTAGAPSQADPSMATMGEINRAEDSGGASAIKCWRGPRNPLVC